MSPAADGPHRARESDGPPRRGTPDRGLSHLRGREAATRTDHVGRRAGHAQPRGWRLARRAGETSGCRRGARGVLPFRRGRPARRLERLLRRSRDAPEGSREGLGDASPRRGEGDARRTDRPRGDADERGRGRVLEIDGLPDRRSNRVRSGYRLAPVDDHPVGAERFLSELLPALGATDPRAAPFGVFGLQRAEELGHLERDLRGHERVAERAFELRPEVDDANAHPRFHADRVAEAEVRARAIGANDLLVRQDGSFDADPGREAAVRWDRFDLDDPRAFFVQEARMRDVPDAGDPIPAPEVLVEAGTADLARRALGLRPAVDEFVARVGLSLADERDLDHDEGLSRT